VLADPETVTVKISPTAKEVAEKLLKLTTPPVLTVIVPTPDPFFAIARLTLAAGFVSTAPL
jgi:hypothetical protein